MAILMVVSLQPGPFQIKIGEWENQRNLRILKRDYRRTTSHPKLLSRTELEKGLKLFKRILDELDFDELD